MAELSSIEKPLQPSMAELLDQAAPLQSLHRGDIVEGQVMRCDSDGILVSIGHKLEGIIPAREMRLLSRFGQDQSQVGATVLVYVLDPAGVEGQAILSLDKAQGEEVWHRLQQCAEAGQGVTGTIVGFNRGGAVVDVEGLQAFVPLSQMVLSIQAGGDTAEALAQRVGEEVSLKVLEVNRRRGRAVLSERAMLREQREEQREQLFGELQEGEVRKGVVTGISSFGAFVDIGGADGLIHISELSWSPVSSVEEVVQVSQEVEVYILRVDREHRRIALSLRQLSPTPWTQAAQQFALGQLVSGTVTKLADFGAFTRVEETVEGLIHVSELSDRHIRHPREVVQVGDSLTLRIVSLDLERHRIGLSLRQVEDPEGKFEESKTD
uniref:Putative S1 RNA binding domain protein n=1 Tax=uncultured marine microorganism HF4000_APKG7H23 TaxID=455551 RepID=B3T9S8_9ZZZZ|nr:putative S1 RNA binding domain protein [uncultured marine microorganism HF4000_APKG7H23]